MRTAAFHVALCALALPALAPAQQSAAVPQTEQSDVATLSPQKPHRIFTLDSYGEQGVRIIDAGNLKIEGMLQTNSTSTLALDPAGKYFYISETIYTKGNRGTRQDMVTVYDSSTLNLVTEIPLPGRLIIDARTHIFDISASGTYGYVYNLQPASSVVIVNLHQRKVASTVELPGCALAFPWKDGGFASLCGDGSLATVVIPASGKPTVTHSASFFNADLDPIYEESVSDRDSGRALFLSYTGKIYPAQLSEKPTIDQAWSLTESAGMPAAGTGVQELAWRPGGNHPIAWHKARNRIYVLMHPGNHWTHKEAGTELWIVDATAHKTIRRIKLPEPATAVGITQDDQPILFVLTRGDRHLVTFDEATGQKKDESKGVAGRIAWTTGF